MADDSEPQVWSVPADPTPEQLAEMQAAVQTAQAQQVAAQNAATLATLTPVAFMAGPGWAADLNLLRTNKLAIGAVNQPLADAINNLLITADHANLLFNSTFLAVGGVAPAT